MNEKVDMKEGCERRSFLFATVEWQDNNVTVGFGFQLFQQDIFNSLACVSGATVGFLYFFHRISFGFYTIFEFCSETYQCEKIDD